MSNEISLAGRQAMKHALLKLFPVAEALEAYELREAVEACVVLLDAPGPLDKKTLAPLLKLTHERAAELFRQGAEETTGSLKAKMEDGVKRAEQEAVWMEELLEELEPDEPS